MFIRNSKFRHIYGLPTKKDQCYEGFRIARSAHDPSLSAVNPWFVAMAIESSGGGTFIVIPIKMRGRLLTGHPRVLGHAAPITDLKWNPFQPCVIASSSEDCTVKVWRLPSDGLHFDISRCWRELKGHTKRVTHIEWHPTAKDVLLSAGADLQCIVWDVESDSAVRSLFLHPELILSIAWNYNGSLLASTCRDRRIRIIDPRKGIVVTEGDGHEGSKSSKVVFLKDRNWVFTTGFSRGCQRQMAIWNSSDLSSPVHMEDVDSSSGTLIPFFDPDTSVMYLAGKGDGNIRYYEIDVQQPNIVYLSQYQSNSPQCGIAMMPKYGVDPSRCELMRFYKLHTTKDLCEPISMIAPRRCERFQEDIFPPTFSPEPALSAKEWLSGQDAEPKKISMKNIEQTLTRIFSSFPEDLDLQNDPNEEQLHGRSLEETDGLKRTTSDEAEMKSDDEDTECFQRGMVRLNVEKFTQEYLNPVAEPLRGTLTPQRPHTSTMSNTELKTSSYHLKMSIPNGFSPAAAVESLSDKSNDRIGGISLVDRQNTSSGRTLILRQATTTLPSSSSQLLSSPVLASNKLLLSTDCTTNSSLSQTEKTPWNKWSHQNYSDQIPFDPKPEIKSKTQGNGLLERQALLRSKSELPMFHSQYPSSTTVDSVVWASHLGAEEKYEDGKIDFISTDAPDDTVIKPSFLRSSMRSRPRIKDSAADSRTTSSHMYRRATSLREPRTKRDLRQLVIEGSKLPTATHKSSTYLNNWTPETLSDEISVIKREDPLKVPERRSTKIYVPAGTESSMPGSTTEGSSFSKTPSGVLMADNSTKEGSFRSKSTSKSDNVLNVSPFTQEEAGFRKESDDSNCLSDHLPGNANDPTKLKNAGMEYWKQKYERILGPSINAADRLATTTTPIKSQENVILTTNDVTDDAKRGTECIIRRSGDVTAQEHEDESKSRKYAFNYAGSINNGGTTADRPEAEVRTGTAEELLRLKEEPSPPTDYDELLSMFFEQRKELRRLRVEVSTRDRTIQSLHKRLSLLLRQSIAMPSLDAFR